MGPRHPPNPGPQSESLRIVLLKVHHAHKSSEEPVTEQTRFSSLGGAEASTFITALRPDVVTVLGSGQGSPPELPGMVYSLLRALQPFQDLYSPSETPASPLSLSQGGLYCTKC